MMPERLVLACREQVQIDPQTERVDFEPMSERVNYPLWHRAVEITAIAAYLAILIVVLHHLFAHAMWSDPAAFAWAFSAVFAGLVAADFVSGFVHWAADSFGTPEWPFLGRAYIKPFRDHHDDPKGITHHDFVEVNGNNCVTILLFLPFVAAAHALLPEPAQLWLLGWTAAFTVAVFFTNQIHSWAHADSVPAFVAVLQRHHIILSPKSHDLHHTPPHSSYFCITFGWLNPLLARTDFFGRLYRIIKGQRRPADAPSTTR